MLVAPDRHTPVSRIESALTFARCEGTIPAPESAHAIHSVVLHARRARDAGERPVILFNLSGHGIFDLAAYEAFLSGRMAGKTA